jgi:hypothetical protein
MKLKHSLLIACLSAAPVCAQQAEQNAEVRKIEKSESSSTGDASATATVTVDVNGVRKTETRTSRPGRNQPPPGNPPGQPPQDPKPVTYIGVMTRDVSPELRSQFSLPEGFGIMVDEVMPDSPAQHAGIKTHDILLKFEDQQLVNMEQLMLLVRAKKKGDVVNITLISGGQEKQVPVTLGEHVMPAVQHGRHPNFAGMPQNGVFFFNGDPAQGGMHGFQKQGQEMNAQMQRFQKEMKEYQQRIQDWARQNNGAPMPQPPAFNMPGKPQPQPGHVNGIIQVQPSGGNVQQFNFSEAHAATNITRRDDSGEYTLKTEDGKTTFTARPNNGKEQTWPVSNEAERNAVPPEFRDKLRMMDGAQSGIHIQIHPGPGGAPPPPPAPGGVNQPATPPQNTKPTTSA